MTYQILVAQLLQYSKILRPSLTLSVLNTLPDSLSQRTNNLQVPLFLLLCPLLHHIHLLPSPIRTRSKINQPHRLGIDTLSPSVFADSLTPICAYNPPKEASNASTNSPRWRVSRHRRRWSDRRRYRFCLRVTQRKADYYKSIGSWLIAVSHPIMVNRARGCGCFDGWNEPVEGRNWL